MAANGIARILNDESRIKLTESVFATRKEN
jgi:hypothetical protein